MVGTKAGKSSRPMPSCTECHRRKQKCNRQWPCNHCHSRKIPHLCKFSHKNSKIGSNSLDQPRKVSSDESSDVKLEQASDAPSELRALGTEDELRVLGYLPDDHNLLMGNPLMASEAQSSQSGDSASPEVKEVLRLLPPKPYTDILIQRYLETTNFMYYAIYTLSFSNDYASWWSDRANGRSLSPEFTCLLARVCACSAQYLDSESQRRLESDLGEPSQTLSESLHHSAIRLSNTIPPGRGGLVHVQQLFLTAAWYKSESLFVESWHSLSSCIHEAQEQGMHKISQKTGLSEFDVEMRRRMWCILYTWDWQMALLLSRPLIINQGCRSFELPNMKLEAQDPQDGAPSPIAHILVQCQLGLTVTRLDPAPEGAVDTSKAGLLKELVTEWLGSLPPAYRETDPDTRWDDQLLYIPLQRRQLHAIGYMTMFGPFKPYLTKVYDSSSTGADRASREAAVDVGLHLMTVSRRLFDQVFPINAKFHIVTFLIFDTAAFLCSAIIHDKDHSLPRHEEVFRSVRLACSLVKQLSPITKTAAICYPVLTKLANSLRKPAKKASPGPVASDSISQLDSLAGLTPESSTETISPDALGGSSESIAATDVFFPASLDFPVQAMLTPPITGVSDFSDMDIGQFDQIWDWQDLDLNFLPEMPVQ